MNQVRQDKNRRLRSQIVKQKLRGKNSLTVLIVLFNAEESTHF